MIILDQLQNSIFEAKTTPLIGGYFFNALIEAIEKAQRSIFSVQYQWKWNIHQRHSHVQQLGDAIIRARGRGVAVSVILNHEGVKRHISIINRVSGDRLSESGCSVKMLRTGSLLHTKLWVIDDLIVFIGSHNISTRSLTTNEEVSVKIESSEINSGMKQYFERLWVMP